MFHPGPIGMPYAMPPAYLWYLRDRRTSAIISTGVPCHRL
jgi:hypothetical protein